MIINVDATRLKSYCGEKVFSVSPYVRVSLIIASQIEPNVVGFTC